MAKTSKKQIKRTAIVKCPHCDYTCKGTQPLGRHIHFHHSELVDAPKVSIRLATLRELLVTASDAMSTLGPSDTKDKLVQEVRRQEVEIRLTLAALVRDKIERIQKFAPVQIRLDDRLIQKLEEQAALEDLGLKDLRSLQRYVNGIITVETAFLESILSMKGEATPALYSRLIDSLKATLVAGDRRVAVEKTKVLTLVKGLVPEDRDEIRSFVKQLGSGGSDESESRGSEMSQPTLPPGEEGPSEGPNGAG